VKQINFIILVVLLSISFLFKEQIKVSTNLVSLFASKETIQKLDIADNLGYSKEMFVVVKGFSKASESKVHQISKELQKIDKINFVQSSIVPSQEVQDFYKKYYPLLATFDDKYQSKDEIRNRLQKLYDSQFTNIFYRLGLVINLIFRDVENVLQRFCIMFVAPGAACGLKRRKRPTSSFPPN
jgi:hypothetical protein